MSRRRTTAALLAIAALAASAANAGSFQVNPIRVDLSSSISSGAITVRNDGAEPVVVQASVLEWSQADGGDVYAPTGDALATPPIATIAPGAEQIVRVGLRRGADAKRELTYRLFLHEVPPPPRPGFTGLQVALRIGVPVFVAPSAPAMKPLEWSAALAADGSMRLVARNGGNLHHRIADFELRVPGDVGGAIAGVSTVSYVLAGRVREWTLPALPERMRSAPELALKAFTDAGEIDAKIPLDR
jgi:fimbrial chaperone protein